MLERIRKATRWCPYLLLTCWLVMVGLYQAKKVTLIDDRLGSWLVISFFVLGAGGWLAGYFIDWLNKHS